MGTFNAICIPYLPGNWLHVHTHERMEWRCESLPVDVWHFCSLTTKQTNQYAGSCFQHISEQQTWRCFWSIQATSYMRYKSIDFPLVCSRTSCSIQTQYESIITKLIISCCNIGTVSHHLTFFRVWGSKISLEIHADMHNQIHQFHQGHGSDWLNAKHFQLWSHCNPSLKYKANFV